MLSILDSAIPWAYELDDLLCSPKMLLPSSLVFVFHKDRKCLTCVPAIRTCMGRRCNLFDAYSVALLGDVDLGSSFSPAHPAAPGRGLHQAPAASASFLFRARGCLISYCEPSHSPKPSHAKTCASPSEHRQMLLPNSLVCIPSGAAWVSPNVRTFSPAHPRRRGAPFPSQEHRSHRFYASQIAYGRILRLARGAQHSCKLACRPSSGVG